MLHPSPASHSADPYASWAAPRFILKESQHLGVRNHLRVYLILIALQHLDQMLCEPWQPQGSLLRHQQPLPSAKAPQPQGSFLLLSWNLFSRNKTKPISFSVGLQVMSKTLSPAPFFYISSHLSVLLYSSCTEHITWLLSQMCATSWVSTSHGLYLLPYPWDGRHHTAWSVQEKSPTRHFLGNSDYPRLFLEDSSF